MTMTGAERSARWRKRNPETYRKSVQKQLKRAKRRREILKKEVLTHYGDNRHACIRCGENRSACLSIDHIEGGGTKHRKGTLRSADGFYRWLKLNKYPNGYQTLCMNCQFVKRFERGEHN